MACLFGDPRQLFWPVVVAIVSGTWVGCDWGPARVEVPPLQPQAAAQAALRSFDENQDLQISKRESAACPGLLSAYELYDTDRNGQLSEAEIASRLQAMLATGIGPAALHLPGVRG